MKQDTLVKIGPAGSRPRIGRPGGPPAPSSPAPRGPRRQGPRRDGGRQPQRLLAEARGHGRQTLPSTCSKGRSPGGKALIMGNTHAERARGPALRPDHHRERRRGERDPLSSSPSSTTAASRNTRAGDGYPLYFDVRTDWGAQRFRYGNRDASPLDQWPDPDVYIHYPERQLLSYIDVRNTNRTWPGRPDGPLMERVTFGAMELHAPGEGRRGRRRPRRRDDVPRDQLHRRPGEIGQDRHLGLADGQGHGGIRQPRRAVARGLPRPVPPGDRRPRPAPRPSCSKRPSPSSTSRRGPRRSQFLLDGKDPFLLSLSKKKKLFVPYDESGWPLEKRVGQHLSVDSGDPSPVLQEDPGPAPSPSAASPATPTSSRPGVGRYLARPGQGRARRRRHELIGAATPSPGRCPCRLDRKAFSAALAVAAVLVGRGRREPRPCPAAAAGGVRVLGPAPEACTVIMVGTRRLGRRLGHDARTPPIAASATSPGAMSRPPTTSRPRCASSTTSTRSGPGRPPRAASGTMVLKDPTGVEIPQVAHTYGYHHAVFGYMNDQQLAIAESTIGNVRKIANPTPTPATNITMLTLLAMERCRTAREAIRLMGSLAEEYGYGYHDGGEMLAVSDPDGDLDLRDHAGRAAVDTQSGQARRGLGGPARARRPRQRSARTNRASARSTSATPTISWPRPNAESFAVEAGLYDPKSGKPFNWKRAYSPAEGSAASSEGRRSADVALLRPGRPVEEIQGRDAQHGLPLLRQARREALAQGRHGLDPGQVRGHGLRPGPGNARRPVQESQLLYGDAPDQRAQRRVHDPDPVPVVAAGPDRRASSGSPWAPRTRPATSRSTPARPTSPSRSRSATTSSSTGARPAGPSITSISTSRSPTTRPSRTSRRPGRSGRTGPSGASPRSTGRPGTSTAQDPDGSGQVRHRLLPQQRPERRRRLVEARRRYLGQIQPSRPLRRRQAAKWPHSHGQSGLVEQSRSGFRCPERARKIRSCP